MSLVSSEEISFSTMPGTWKRIINATVCISMVVSQAASALSPSGPVPGRHPSGVTWYC